MISVVVPAAGHGRRMMTSVSKQHLLIADKPVLVHTLTAFEQCDAIDEVILVVAQDEVDWIRERYINMYALKKVKSIIVGGETRQASVREGLKLTNELADIVLIHDGARPFVDEEMIERVILGAKKYGAVTVGVVPKDTIKVVGPDKMIKETLNRSDLAIIQTPQGFSREMILKAHELGEAIEVTDDATLVEVVLHAKVALIEGSYHNIKITTPEDMLMGQLIYDSLRKQDSTTRIC